MPNRDFFKRVYALVSRIPSGKVASYGQIAALLGAPRAARTVGWALHSMPWGVEIPWHRVMNSKGAISLGRGGGEMGLQRRLLEEEGVVFDHRGLVVMAKFQWRPEPDDLTE